MKPKKWEPEIISCKGCGYLGPVLSAHYGYKWYYFLIIFTGVGILPLIIGLLVLGNLTYKCCPACKTKAGLLPLHGPPEMNASAIYGRAEAEDQQRFTRNKNSLAGVVFTILAIVLVLVFLV